MRRRVGLVSGILLVGAGVVTLLVSVLMLLFRPLTYAASARIHVGGTSSTDVAEAMARLQAPPLLSQVSSNLNLGAKWGEKDKEGKRHEAFVLHQLQEMVLVHSRAGTGLIEIQVESDSPVEAAAIANSAAAVYCATAGREAARSAVREIIEQAQPNVRPVHSRKAQPVTIYSGLGLGLMGAGGLLLVARRPTIQG